VANTYVGDDDVGSRESVGIFSAKRYISGNKYLRRSQSRNPQTGDFC